MVSGIYAKNGLSDYIIDGYIDRKARRSNIESIEVLDDQGLTELAQIEDEWEEDLNQTKNTIQTIVKEFIPYGCLLVHADNIPNLDKYMDLNTAKTIGYACQTIQSGQALLEEFDRKYDAQESHIDKTNKVITIAKSTFGALGCFMSLAKPLIPEKMSGIWDKGMKLIGNVNIGLSCVSSFINLTKV